MGAFFTSWALWEKLTFVLACALIVTILIGCVKLTYAHWRLRKYAAVAEKGRQDQTLARQMSQRRAQATSNSDEVPFGIRALESGIEIEGVWISRSNTPEPFSRDISRAPSMLERVSRQNSEVEIEQRVPLQRGEGSAISNVSPIGNELAERPATETVTETVITRPARTRHPPLSLSKYGGGIGYGGDGSNVSLQGSSAESSRRRSGSSHTRDISEASSEGRSPSNSSRESSTGRQSARRTHTNMANLGSLRRFNSSSTDFELMLTHRLSQAAETGQLTPRRQRLHQQHTREESARISDLARDIQRALHLMNAKATNEQSSEATLPPADDIYDRTARTSVASRATANHSSFDTEVPFEPEDFLPMHSPAPLSFHQYAQHTLFSLSPIPGSPLSATSSAPRDSFPLQFSPLVAPPNEPPPETTTTTTSSTTQTDPGPEPSNPTFHSTSTPTATTTATPSFIPRRSLTIVRGQGSGFEILAPGSLNPPTTSAFDFDPDPPARTPTFPPLSLQFWNRRLPSDENEPDSSAEASERSHRRNGSAATTVESRSSEEGREGRGMGRVRAGSRASSRSSGGRKLVKKNSQRDREGDGEGRS